MTRISLHPSSVLLWGIANIEACRAGQPRIEPVHFLLAVLDILDDAYQREAEALGLSVEFDAGLIAELAETRELVGLAAEELTSVRRALGKLLRDGAGPIPLRRLHRSDDSRALFQRATSAAAENGDSELRLLHLVSALLADIPEPAKGLLHGRIRPSRQGPAGLERAGERRWKRASGEPRGARTPTLDEIGRDLTSLARQGRLPQVVGRRREIRSMARYLSRTSKRNVLLIGEAGVGKTAIVEGLAQVAVSEGAPEPIRDCRLIQISVADIVAGTKYRGDMEQRVGRLIEEVTSDPHLILFLDEIHLIMGAGTGGEAGLDVASMLKPALARDDFRCVGATTTAEFEKYVRNDEALARRFMILRVAEPTTEQALEICKEWASRIERLQQVTISDDAIRAAVELSHRMIRDRYLPDKAIDLLENAAAYVKVSTLSQAHDAVSKTRPRVTRREVEAVLEEEYGLKASSGEAIDYARAEALLRQRVFGQGDAIDEIGDALRQLGLKGRHAMAPLGVLMFAGPTGVGKTYAAEILREALFPAQDASAGRFHMSELKERHEIARLIGAPPGFVGHDQPGALFRFAQAHPRGVVLLDEVDKAHPEVLDYFLGIFDQGEGRDSQGRRADFSRYLFILTCNLPWDATSQRPMGFRGAHMSRGRAETPRSSLEGAFPEAFLARMDRIITFRPLEEEAASLIVLRQIEFLTTHMRDETGTEVVIAPAVAEGIASLSPLAKEGARGVMKTFDELVTVPLGRLIREAARPSRVRVDWQDGKLVVEAEGKPKPSPDE